MGAQNARILSMTQWSPIARFMGPIWGPSGADSTKEGPMLTHELFYLGVVTVPANCYWFHQIHVGIDLLRRWHGMYEFYWCPRKCYWLWQIAYNIWYQWSFLWHIVLLLHASDVRSTFTELLSQVTNMPNEFEIRLNLNLPNINAPMLLCISIRKCILCISNFSTA